MNRRSLLAGREVCKPRPGSPFQEAQAEAIGKNSLANTTSQLDGWLRHPPRTPSSSHDGRFSSCPWPGRPSRVSGDGTWALPEKANLSEAQM